MNVKLKLQFKDRIGIVADVSTVIALYGLNIAAMEVQRLDDQALVYLSAESESLSNPQVVFDIIRRIPDLADIRVIDTLPQEEKEQRFRIILDNISDGVISIDAEGRITTINRVAKEALNCDTAEMIGRNITSLKLPDYPILECLAGKHFGNVKQNLITETGRYQYFSSGRPIQDNSGRIVGAVEIAKDMQMIKMLAASITEPAQFSFSDIIGRHPSMQAAIAFAQRIAATDAIVSLRGASGTGKELFARAIHTASRRQGPFVPVNCAALPEQLLESELFGYVGGAFTGGHRNGKAGIFEIAREGTIFLDEIGEMPAGAQVKILRAIQEKSVRRIGGSKEIPVDTRIVTATHRNLEHLVQEKAFRQDLYYRINVIPIHIPPLAERSEDIPDLVDHFLFQLSSKLGKKMPEVTKSALNKLLRYRWPGNVRELKNVVERAAFICEEDYIGEDCILFSHEVGKTLQAGGHRLGPVPAGSSVLKEILADYERQIIGEVMAQSKSVRKSARALGLSHTALLNKIRKLKILWKQIEPVEIKHTTRL